MKHKIIVAIAIIIPFILIFIIGLIEYYDKSIHVHKLDYIPTNYFNMTSQQLDDFPHLKKALIKGEGWIKTPIEEWERLHDFLDVYDEWIINYNNEYYHISLATP